MPPRKTPRKRRSKWTADNILTDPSSPLATADLRSVLTHPLAWTSLTVDERRHVLSLFPDVALILDADTEDARPDLESLINDDAFRADCAAYVEDLAQGRHDPQWLRDAWRAHERRKAGEFDDFLVRKFEGDWGPLPEHMRLEARTKKTSSDEADSASNGCVSVQQDEVGGDDGHGMVDGGMASGLGPETTRNK
ncbi:hypothetical protein E4U42_006823 [Claviceps africana]|uniref:DEUBAD domain-containing protein n=1 Tax=Claviceps africana TaxID=83212 RepID=A0A8K0J1W3_9HYPO|nr:hypothetical protein E4U42_006823 [Claviceps africana]